MKISIIGDYNPSNRTHLLTDTAIQDSAAGLGVSVQSVWVPTTQLDSNHFHEFEAVLISPGSPYKDMEKVLKVIQFARENKVPCIGTCGGFHHMVIEYARHELGLNDAQHAESDPYASRIIISKLACSLVGREMQITFVTDSQAAHLYDSLQAIESYYCNFGINPDYVSEFVGKKFHPSGSDSEGGIRVMELVGHPFFIGTLFVPQARSTLVHPHPIITGFIRAIIENKKNCC